MERNFGAVSKLPSDERRNEAVGNVKAIQDPALIVACSNIEKWFQNKKILSEDDWLVSHKENGQSYSQWMGWN
jgi:hypothetical protein